MTDSQPVSDEQIESIARRDIASPSSWFAGNALTLAEHCMRDRRSLLQAIRERDSTIANLRNDSLSYKLQLDQANASISRLERALSATETKVSERDSKIADLHFEMADWIARYKRASEGLDEREKIIEAQRRELAELREFHNKAVERNADVERIRRYVTSDPVGDEPMHSMSMVLLSAYDSLAQDCARYANAHEVLVAEIRGLRERADSLGTKVLQERHEGETLTFKLEETEERELQLREAISEALELRDSAWLAVDTRKTALNNLAAALAASPAPVQSEPQLCHYCEIALPLGCGGQFAAETRCQWKPAIVAVDHEGKPVTELPQEKQESGNG